MAIYNITTGTAAAPVDWAALGTRANGDIYNLNGGYLLVDCDSRFGLGGAAAAAFGNIVGSATLGGSIEFNATKVRLIAFSGGGGTVPAADTIITRGGASGKLIGVYAALNAAPLAAGAAMPATGYIKVRAWNGTPFAVGAFAGITATASAAGGPGWITVVGVDASQATINRLNLFKVRGDYYTFQNATTSGNNATGYQLPTNGSTAIYCPGVEVETAVGSGAFEFYPCAGTRPALATNIATDKLRGRWCWIEAATGLVRFQSDGSNSGGGYLPPAGCKLRVANIFFACCTAGASVNSAPHATLASRYKFNTAGGGVIDVDKASINWYLTFAQSFSTTLTDTAGFEQITLSECASPVAWSNVNIGQSGANSQIALAMTFNFAGGSMARCTWTRAAQASSGHYIASWADCSGFAVSDQRIHSLTKGANATIGSMLLNRVSGSQFANCIFGGGQTWLSTCADVKVTRSSYYDHPATTTSAAIPMYAFSVAAACSRCTFDGLDFGGLTMAQPLAGILNIAAAGCSDIKLRNLGSYAEPLDLGAARQDNVAWTRSSTTATVTLAGHGLKVGDVIYVPVSSSTAAITVSAKTISAAPGADTFSFACLNAGPASGTLCYFPTVCANLVVFATSAAANGVKVQRCYTPHTSTNLFSADNSSKNVRLENVISDFLNPFLTPVLNCQLRGVSGTPPLTAQTSIYGTHFIDVFNADVTPNLTSQAWSRTSTVCTVTSADHKLRTGLLINVNESSDLAAVPRGIKSVTAIDANTYSFACPNAGATSGTVDVRTVIDRIILLMNEATADTANQYGDIVGNPVFTSAGGLFMPTPGDSITFTMPDWLLGHEGFPIQEAVMLGGTIANYRLEYAIDKNNSAGFSAFKNLYYARPGAVGTLGANTFTVTDATGVALGDYVWGTGIAGNAKVTAIAGNTITVDNANVATVSGIVRFNQIRNELGIDPSKGFRLKLRITTAIANTTAITSLSIYTDTSVASRAHQYALDSNTVTFTGLPTGCDAVVLAAGSSNILAQQDEGSGSNFAFTFSGPQNVDVGFIRPGYVPLYIRNLALGASDATIPVAMTADRNYQ